MENERYKQLQKIISEFPHIHRFLNDNFIKTQCTSNLKCYLLIRLDNKEYGYTTRQHLPTLERRLSKLASITGYNRLKPLLRGASNWDEYQEFLDQIDITLWFEEKNILKEIEPELPHREGNADALLSFSEQDIYCEVTSPESLQKSIESKKHNEVKKVQSLLNKQPWMSKQEVEHELKINRTVRNLLDKTKRQLPPNHPCILALETGKSMVLTFDTKKIAQKLFPTRPQVMLIMLWSLERGSQIGEAPFPFVNPNSPYQNIGQKLLKYLGLDNEVIS